MTMILTPEAYPAAFAAACEEYRHLPPGPRRACRGRPDVCSVNADLALDLVFKQPKP